MRVKYLETLYHYDRPILYVAAVEGGGLALVMVLDEVEHPTELNRRGTPALVAQTLVVRANQRRIDALRSNCTTLREAFRFPEDRTWYVMTEYDGWWEFNGCVARADPPLDEWLSTGGARLVFQPGKYRQRTRPLTRRERCRAEIRVRKGVEHRPQRHWNKSLWQANVAFRERQAALKNAANRAD